MKKTDLSTLLDLAKRAQKNAIVPYSNFPVGAALVTKSGRIFTGCNIEVSSYGLTICAERVALFKALSEGESEFSRLVVSADTKQFCSPCGACRQVLIEYAPEIQIILLNSENKIKQTMIADLLPQAFNKNILKNRKQ
ncbi:MAG: cytidine deaminase [bacterium]